MKNRLDKELLLRQLVPSRTKAQELINANLVLCNDKIVNKSSFLVSENDDLKIKFNDKLKYVGRGGLKLEKAINEFKINFNGLKVMDIGSSTGGFCDCALKHGAKKIVAIDVGTSLLHESLRNNQLIDLHEQTNFKDLNSKYFKDIDIIVCDVSFISLKSIIDKIFNENIKVELICLIKPQFECGKTIATKYKGIILDSKVHLKVINELLDYFNDKGFFMKNLTFSPIRGGDGNIEYLISLTNKINENISIDILNIVKSAFKSTKNNTIK